MSSAPGCACGHSIPSCQTEFQYAAKILCGIAESPVTSQGPVAPGQYFTAVNIHNPSKCDFVSLRWKVAAAAIAQPGAVTPFSRLRLGPDEAAELDCPQFMRFFPALNFLKGFLVIQSPEELDVVAVYTASQAAQGPVNLLQTERVPGRCVPVCEDLNLPLSTGVADWRTIIVPAGPITPAAPVIPVAPNALWNAPPFGSVFVSAASGDSVSAAPGQYVYQLCFDLCSGFGPPTLSLQGIADDSAVVSLNGTVLGPTSAFNVPPATIPNNASLYRAGQNCFQIQVNNTSGATGFALGGLLRSAGGRCPCVPLPILTPASFGRVPGAAPDDV